MKKFRIIGMVLAAIIMGVSFTSCNPDKEVPAKKLVKFTCSETSEATFKYDEQGRLIECIDYTIYNDETDIYTYVWNENTIDFTYKLGGIYDLYFTLELENCLVSKFTTESHFFNNFFKYNSYGRLIECSDIIRINSLEWDDDKLIKNHFEDPVYMPAIDTYSYDKKYTTEGYNPLIPFIITREFLYVAHPEIAGLATQKLYNNETSYAKTSDSEYTNSFKYEYGFDEDGYVNKILIKHIEENDTIIDEYNMIWE